MKHLKSYKIFESNDEIDIETICKNYGIKDYTINDDGTIDVDDDVFLDSRNLYTIPLRFRNVSGGFYCQRNQLTSLDGCPISIGGYFDCSINKLTSLEGGPLSVGGDMECTENELTSLKGSPKIIDGYFNFSNNNITSFVGIPEVGYSIYCDNNPIDDLWFLFGDDSKIELFNEFDITRDDNTLILDRLNDFLLEIGKEPVEEVDGWKCI